jgi:hypothetical protein
MPDESIWERPSSANEDEEAALPDLSQLSDEELAALGKSLGVEIAPGSGPREPLPAGARLVTARSLLPPDYDEDQGDFEPSPEGLRYKGFLVVDREDWPVEADVMPDASKGIVGHANQERRFYVYSPGRVIGLVPWPGSLVVWPWESAWIQGLYRPQVTSLLKEEKKEKKR